MVVEDFIWDNAGMLTEVIAVVLSELVDGALLLTHLPTLLPYPVLIVQMLQEPDRPFRPPYQHAACTQGVDSCSG